MPTPPTLCAQPGCDRPAGYKTRTKPAWCDEHITEILRTGGLRPLEPFTGPNAWRLTECLACGVKAHYRFVYTLEKNEIDEPTCRACYWRSWAQENRRRLGSYESIEPIPLAQARESADEHGYDYLGPLTDPSLVNDPHHVRCRYCGRLSAQRLGDIAWGCQCQVNPRRDREAARESASPKRAALFKDSGLEAVSWWDHARNQPDAWATASPRGRRSTWWKCPDCGECFESRIVDMAARPECPVCEPLRRIEWQAAYDSYKNTPVAAVPGLMTAWDDEADPTTVMVAGSWESRRFRCPQGHHPQLSPLTYLQSGCPHCRGQLTLIERLTSIEVDPESFEMNREIAAQWHPTRNGRLDVRRLSPNSRKTVWWYEPSCGHEWQASPAEREKRQRLKCPVCRTILDSLAYHFPTLATQWSPANPLTAWQVRPAATLPFTPEWVCPDDPSHFWSAALASRTSGSGCPMCREAGKSSVELRHLEAARAVFGNAASGRPVRHPAFVARGVWHPDITVELSDGRTLVIEYDGSHWHTDKLDVDTAKTRDLLAAELLVARCREYPLPRLAVDDPGYFELTVYSAAPDPTRAVEQIADWCARDSDER